MKTPVKVILPWAYEIAMEPKKIRKHIDRQAVENWYHDCSGHKRRSADNASLGFLMREQRRVREFIAKLSDLERVVIYLRYWENLLCYEISEILGLSENKIDGVIDDAVRNLRGLYIQELNRVQSKSSTCA